MEKLTISRAKWHRGNKVSALLMPDTKKMCCLGFLSLACGIKEERIKKVTMPAGIGGIAHSTPQLMQFLVRNGYNVTNTEEALLLSTINDCPLNDDLYLNKSFDESVILLKSEQQREELLTKVFARNGWEVTFTD